MSPSHLHVVANGGETERPEASRPERGKNRVRRRPVLDGLHDTRHVGGRRVIEGSADCAQWVIPSDANGIPLVSEIEAHIGASRLPQRAKDRPRAMGIALAS